MLTSKSSAIRLLACFFVFSLVATHVMAQASRQTETAGQEDVLKSLLKEVQLLRLALERNNLIAHRSEVLIGRLRAQQDRVDRLARELEAARKQISESRFDPAQAAEQVEDMEKKVEAGTIDAAPVKQLKAEIAHQERLYQRLIEREVILAQELETEKINLNELKIRLDALERLFDEVEDASKQLQKKNK
jgi:hypothetical protein